MGTNEVRKSCVKCHKMVDSTETVLVCGLWCGQAFHCDCVGLTHSETRVVTCSNGGINFHCETCRSRLGVELVGEQEKHEPNKLQNCLLDLMQKILKLTNELSNDNSVIHKKLDTVISSNTRLEEYIVQSLKFLEKRGDEIIGNYVDYVESFSAKRTTEVSEGNNDSNADNPSVNSALMSQQTDDNSSSLHSASHILRQVSDNQNPLDAEECSSNKWEVPGHQNTLQDPLSIVKEEHIPSEDIHVHSLFSIAKTEYEEDEEIAVIEIKEEECSSSEDFLECGTSSIDKIEEDVDGEPGRDNTFEELKYEVKPASSENEVERTVTIGLDDLRNKDDRSHLITKDVWTVRKGRRIQCTTNQEVSCANNETFKQETTLKQHSHLHSGEHPYSCTLCNKTFTLKSSLRKHLRLHTGERPYSCRICNKAFTQISSMRRHMRLHSDERPFSCSVCNIKHYTIEGHSTVTHITN